MSRAQTLGALFLLTAAMALFLNLRQMFFEPLALWARVSAPILLLVACIGGSMRNVAVRFVGWIGVVCFILIVLVTAIPGEDYVLGGPDTPAAELPRSVSGIFLMVRLIVAFGLSALWIVTFRRLRVSRP